MNKRMVLYFIGWIFKIEAICMLLPIFTALFYKEVQVKDFIFTAILCLVLGFIISAKKPENTSFNTREGLVSVGLGWIVMSMSGAIPFVIDGCIPSYVDALFEVISGFTTTGATILTDVEALPRSMLMWRSFLHWLGGMGVIVFLLAIIPRLGGQQNIFLMKAESPGPIVGKAVPKMRNYAMMLYGIYFGLTALEFIFLIVGKMPVFDALNISFATAGTGGFGVTNAGIASYNNYLQTSIAVFMMLFGINFSVYILILAKKFKQAFRIQELWVYFGIIVLSTALIAFNIRSLYPSAYDAVHQSFFYVSSILTTTGFGLTDVNNWPEFSKTVIMIITFIGAMAGSTGGGFKVSRVILLFKETRKEFSLLIHPRNVKTVKMDGKTIDHSVMRSTSIFLVLYIGIFALSWLVLSLDQTDFVTSFTAVAANINNTGPGLGMVGPVGNYSEFSILSKIILIFDMLAGRLELFPLMLLFAPSAWKKS